MSTIERLNRLIRANLNDLASRAAGRTRLGEVRESLREAKTQLVESRLAEKRLVTEYERLLDESQQWEDRALVALRGNDEALARRALERKHDIDRQARSVKEQLDAQRAYLTDLTRSLDAVDVKLQALRERRRAEAAPPPGGSAGPAAPPPSTAPPGQWSASARPPASAQLEAQAELGPLGRPELFDDFDAMGERLGRAEAEVEALRELGGTDVDRWDDDDLERRFRALEADRDLARLRGKAADLGDLRKRLEEE